MLAAPVLTLSMIASAPTLSPAASVDTARALPSVPTASVEREALSSDAPVASAAGALWFTLVPAFWMVGVTFFGLRLVGGWMVSRRLVSRGTTPVDDAVDALARDVANRLGLRRAVRLIESSRVTVPVMFGWLRPVVLLPAATIAGMTPVQLEAVIAHELAHVRRHDYLVNLLQTVAEALLFFHPAVWWVSRYIRREREHCCDDAVVRVCDRMEYVSALTHLAKAGRMRMALAASDGSLLRRVRRLLTESEPATSGWMPVLVVLMLAGGLAPIGLTTGDGVEAMRSDAGMSAEARARVSAAERELHIAQAEVEFRQHSARLSQLQAEREGELQRLLERVSQLDRAREVEEVRRMQRDLRAVAEAEQRTAQDAPFLSDDSSDPIVAGNVVYVTIEGEPDFPPAYSVGDAGTIRLPLLGVFTVGGRTTADVAAEIRAALARAGLTDAVVHVRTIRVRRVEPG